MHVRDSERVADGGIWRSIVETGDPLDVYIVNRLETLMHSFEKEKHVACK